MLGRAGAVKLHREGPASGSWAFFMPGAFFMLCSVHVVPPLLLVCPLRRRDVSCWDKERIWKGARAAAGVSGRRPKCVQN